CVSPIIHSLDYSCGQAAAWLKLAATIMPPEISVTLPLSRALERTRRMLFEPFDLRKWLVVGFCAWVATLGESGFNGAYRQEMHSGQGSPISTFKSWLEQIHQYVVPNLWWIVPAAIGLTVLVVALWVTVLWLSSRGRFMFLYCV